MGIRSALKTFLLAAALCAFCQPAAAQADGKPVPVGPMVDDMLGQMRVKCAADLAPAGPGGSTNALRCDCVERAVSEAFPATMRATSMMRSVILQRAQGAMTVCAARLWRRSVQQACDAGQDPMDRKDGAAAPVVAARCACVGSVLDQRAASDFLREADAGVALYAAARPPVSPDLLLHTLENQIVDRCYARADH